MQPVPVSRQQAAIHHTHAASRSGIGLQAGLQGNTRAACSASIKLAGKCAGHRTCNKQQ
jgi:hypothetical protein